MRSIVLTLKISLAVVLVLLCIPPIWILLSVFESEILLYQAERIAGSRPYCIVVSDKDRPLQYKTATQKADLSYTELTTHLSWGGSSGPFADTYYALLVLQHPEDIRNWSKRSLNFKDDVNPMQSSLYQRDLSKLCTPVVNFAASIQH